MQIFCSVVVLGLGLEARVLVNNTDILYNSAAQLVLQRTYFKSFGKAASQFHITNN